MKPKRKPHYSQKKKAQNVIFKVERDDTLLASLVANLPHKSRNTLKAVLRDRQVVVDGKSVTQFDHPLKSGQQVEVSWNKVAAKPQPRGLNIIFEDQSLIVIDKPAGLLTIATAKEKRKTAYSMLSNYVKLENPENKIFIIHRIDRETSGLLMFAKNEKIKRQIQETWGTTIRQRTYVGVVEGQVTRDGGTITSYLKESKAFTVYSSQNPIHGQKSVTHYEKIKENRDFTLLKINLETGRKHQIRVHMQDINHPIVGDKKYGSKQSPVRRMCLHAQVLSFTHPETGKPCYFETAIPKKFRDLFS